MTYEQLANLRCVSSFAAPPSISADGYPVGTVRDNRLVCCERDAVFVFDVSTGELLRRVPVANADSIRWAGDGYILDVRDEREMRQRHLVFLPLDGEPATVSSYGGHLKSWSAATSELAFFDRGRFEVRRWPSMSLVHALAGYHPAIDWASRLILASDGDAGRHVIESIDPPHERRYFDYEGREPQFLYPLGNGVADLDHGCTLVGLRAGWRTTVCTTEPEDGVVSWGLTADRGGIRAVLDDRPCRVDLDFATGELLTPPVTPGVGWTFMNGPLWHALVDAVFLDVEGRESLCAMNGEILVRLPPGAVAKQWFDDGRALLVTYPSCDSQLRIEVWRCPA